MKKINWYKPIRTTLDYNTAKLLSRNFKNTCDRTFVVSYAVNEKQEAITLVNEEGKGLYVSIENIPEKHTGWINVYDPHVNPSPIHETRELADTTASSNRVARIKIEWEESQFDE